MRTPKRAGEVRAFDHIKGQRRYYRRMASTALHTLIERGWRKDPA